MNHHSKLDSSFHLFILIDDRTNLQKYFDNDISATTEKLQMMFSGNGQYYCFSFSLEFMTKQEVLNGKNND